MRRSVKLSVLLSSLAIFSMSLTACSSGDGKLIVPPSSVDPVVVVPPLLTDVVTNLVGELDTAFNLTGIQISQPFSSFIENIIGILPFPNGSSALVARSGGNQSIQGYSPIGESVAHADSFNSTCASLFGIAFNCRMGSVLTQADGKSLIGYMINNEGQKIAFVRINSDGSLDSSFGDGGKSILNSQVAKAEPFAMTELADGSILAVAEMAAPNIQAFSPVVIKLLSNGNLDTAFGSQGIAHISQLWNAYYMAANPKTGDIYLGGKNSSIPSPEYVMHLSSSGIADTSFGSEGTAVVSSTTSRGWNSMQFDSANQKLVVLSNAPSKSGSLRVVRLNLDGTFDSTFGTNGVFERLMTTSDTSTYSSSVIKLETKADRILVLGTLIPQTINVFGGTAPVSQFVLTAITASGTLDKTFGSDGILMGSSTDYMKMTSMEFGPDHKLLLGGYEAKYRSVCMNIFADACIMNTMQLISESGAVVKIK
jgi:uncharacterized delta-60 repeat protein